jgi:carbon-monoxide dehydrogenase large subunit
MAESTRSIHGEVQTSGLGFTGQSVKRVEDERFLVGRGVFVADLNPDGVLHAAFVRSPYPHARIVNVDVAAAKRMPGVVQVLTGAELNAVTNPVPPLMTIAGVYTPLWKPLSDHKVRHVGDPVAIVVATSRHRAEDALEQIVVDYEELEAVGSVDHALRAGTAQLWDRANGNLLGETVDTFGDVERAFTQADRIITKTFDSHRLTNQPMETRGILVEIDDGAMTIHSTSQAPHLFKWLVAAVTAKPRIGEALRSIATNRERARTVASAVRSLVAEQRDNLRKQDPADMRTQATTENAVPTMARMGFGLLAAYNLPTIKAVDIGGGFGSKGPVSREELAVAAAAKHLGRSVQWIEDRVENLTNGGQAREERLTMSLAVDNDGTFRGLKCDGIIDHGAYPAFPFGPPLIQSLWKVYMPGPYDFEAFQLTCRIVATNKGTVVPYRGPWAHETWGRERIIDVAAAELGISPFELRRKNMIGDDKLPMQMITGPDLDATMSVAKTLERAVELIDFQQLEHDKVAARERNHRIGIGVASYHEAAPGPANFNDAVQSGSGLITVEEGRAAIFDDGRIVMYTAQSPHGQSHQTTYRQVVADEFGVPLDQVEIRWGNTDETPFTVLGTGGSRGAPLGAGVMRMTARELRRLVVEMAAELLEASVDDVIVVDGNIHVAGVPARGVTYADVAEAKIRENYAKPGAVVGPDIPAFDYSLKYEGAGNGGWSVATHVAFVDIDLDTGFVRIPRYFVVEDCGRIINPAVVDGQVRGGVAQGIGAVFYERAAYDESANLTSTTYMDYLIPTSMEIPHIEVHHLETVTGGDADSRGTGEGGMIGAPPALTNAVSDALGVQVTDLYLPPHRILELAGVLEG